MPIDRVSSCRPTPVRAFLKFSQSGERFALFLECCPDGRQAHESPQAQSWKCGNGQCELRQGSWRDARLARLVIDVHLDAQVQRFDARRPLLTQSFGNLQSVDSVNPVEVLGHSTRFVGLQVTDKVPDQVVPAGLEPFSVHPR